MLSFHIYLGLPALPGNNCTLHSSCVQVAVLNFTCYRLDKRFNMILHPTIEFIKFRRPFHQRLFFSNASGPSKSRLPRVQLILADNYNNAAPLPHLTAISTCGVQARRCTAHSSSGTGSSRGRGRRVRSHREARPARHQSRYAVVHQSLLPICSWRRTEIFPIIQLWYQLCLVTCILVSKPHTAKKSAVNNSIWL